jgi:hypothetical protein
MVDLDRVSMIEFVPIEFCAVEEAETKFVQSKIINHSTTSNNYITTNNEAIQDHLSKKRRRGSYNRKVTLNVALLKIYATTCSICHGINSDRWHFLDILEVHFWRWLNE